MGVGLADPVSQDGVPDRQRCAVGPVLRIASDVERLHRNMHRGLPKRSQCLGFCCCKL